MAKTKRATGICEGQKDGLRCGAPGNHTDWRKDVGTVSLCEIHHLSDVLKCCCWCGVYDEIRDDGYCSNGCRQLATMAGVAR